MDLFEAMQSRHSVRSYTDKQIEGDTEEQLRHVVNERNQESGLNIQLCLNEPKAFDSMMARYGKFKNVRNYIALVGQKGSNLDESCGYHGERIVLKAQQLGLNTCWVGASYSKGKSPAVIGGGEKLRLIISVGYGEMPGTPHKSKQAEQLCRVDGDMPDWFKRGMDAVLLAPTAMNQQKFMFELSGNKVKARALSGFYAKVDLGIAKCHFEIGAEDGDWEWA